MPDRIPFNLPYMTGNELTYIAQAHANERLAGDGPFTKKCNAWLQTYSSASRALLTHSCTAALEMAALLLDIQPGDEVIMPSYTFVSTANAFALRGGIPVFVDIREDTLNIDEELIESSITANTKGIVPVHYAGVSCNMAEISRIAQRHNLLVVEDAAQGVMSSYQGKPLGSLGDLGAFSFHETKNIISGEGGALIVNNKALAARAEVIWEKGTDRGRFFRGEVDKYTWQDVGSSYLPGEIIAAFLCAQLEQAQRITDARLVCWNYYHAAFESLEKSGFLRRPIVPDDCQHNAHMYYILLAPGIDRQAVIEELKRNNISAVFHYVPLHNSPGGQTFGKSYGDLPITEDLANRLVRLPLWVGMTEVVQNRVVAALTMIGNGTR